MLKLVLPVRGAALWRCAIALAMTCAAVHAQANYQVILTLGGSIGGGTTAPLTLYKGKLYGTGLDNVYEISRGTAGTWNGAMLGKMAFEPFGKLIFDRDGILYGTTVGSTTSCDCGTVFEFIPNADGSWTQNTLYNFTGGDDGSFPYGGLVMDGAGNLYGTACKGGSGGHGVAFQLSRNADGTWTEHILYSFTGARDGESPLSTLTFHNGLLYGTTLTNVFRLKRGPNNTWTESVLYTFKGGIDGSTAYAGVIADKAGNLYGTTVYGGTRGCGNQGCGTVYRLTPTTSGTWTERVLYRFRGGADGAAPDFPALVRDKAGNLYGTTVFGGNNPGCLGGDCGMVFELKLAPGDKWTEVVLHRFGNFGADDGYQPAGVILDSRGHLFGATGFGADYNEGVLYEITP